MSAAEAADLDDASRVIAVMSGEDKYYLRGKLLFEYGEVMPRTIKLALCRRPQGADVEELTLLGCFDEALAQAYTWRKRYATDRLARQAAEDEARFICEAAEAEAVAKAAAAAEERRHAEMIARYTASRDAPVTVGGIVLPPVTQTGKVTHIVASEPHMARQEARRKRQDGQSSFVPTWLSGDLRRELARSRRTSTPESNGGETTAPQPPKPQDPAAQARRDRKALRLEARRQAKRLPIMTAMNDAVERLRRLEELKCLTLSDYGQAEREFFIDILRPTFSPDDCDVKWLQVALEYIQATLDELNRSN